MPCLKESKAQVIDQSISWDLLKEATCCHRDKEIRVAKREASERLLTKGRERQLSGRRVKHDSEAKNVRPNSETMLEGGKEAGKGDGALDELLMGKLKALLTWLTKAKRGILNTTGLLELS